MARVNPGTKAKAGSVPKRLSATKARREFADLVNRVAFSGERIVLERHGKSVMALVSVQDLELLEKLEDKLDLREARRRIVDREDKSMPWRKVKAKLAL